MKRILIGGAGGAPAEGVINSLRESEEFEVIGIGSEPTDLVLSSAERKYYVPYANHPNYRSALGKILEKEKPALIHFQNDLEIFHASQFRNDFDRFGVACFMPEHSVVDTCVHKYKTYLKFKAAGLVVPENILLEGEADLKMAFSRLGDAEGRIWIRSASIGAGGAGSLPTNDFDMARSWIARFKGWGTFVAASMLSADTVTWLSIWYKGQLVVAQTRARKGWVHGNRSASGVTGVTKVGETVSDPIVDDISQKAILAVDPKPHGIYGVDLTYDLSRIPNPTEINISRFFTTVLFFTEAGLNLPYIFAKLALDGTHPQLTKKINPLPDGLLWLRGMDTKPRLVTKEQIEAEIYF